SSRTANTSSRTRDHFYRNRERLATWEIPDQSQWEIHRPCEKAPGCHVPARLLAPGDRQLPGALPCAPSRHWLLRQELCPSSVMCAPDQRPPAATPHEPDKENARQRLSLGKIHE